MESYSKLCFAMCKLALIPVQTGSLLPEIPAKLCLEPWVGIGSFTSSLLVLNENHNIAIHKNVLHTSLHKNVTSF